MRCALFVVVGALLVACEPTPPVEPPTSATATAAASMSPSLMPTVAATAAPSASATSSPSPTPAGTLAPPAIVREVILAGTSGDHARLASLLRRSQVPCDGRPVSDPVEPCEADEVHGTPRSRVQYIVTNHRGYVREDYAAQILASEFAGGLTFITAGPTPAGSIFASRYFVVFKRASDGRDIPGIVYSQPASARAGLPTCAYLDDSTIVAMRMNCSDDLARMSLRYLWP